MLKPIKCPRSQITFGETRKFDIGDRSCFVTLNVAEDAILMKVFLKGASDPIAQEQQEFVGKMVSLLLRNYIAPERIVKVLIGIKSEPTWNDSELLESVPDALAKMLRRRLNTGGNELLDRFNLQASAQSLLPQSQPKMVARPQALPSRTLTFKIGRTVHRLTATLYNGQPFEVWAIADEQGSESRAFHEALGRLVSIALRMEIPVEEVSGELLGVKSTPTVNIDTTGSPVMFSSATDATGRFLLELAGIELPAPLPVALNAPQSDERYLSTMRMGVTEMVRTGLGKVYVTLNFDDNINPVEVMGAISKAGDEEAALLEWACRATSVALQSAVSIDSITSIGEGITTSPVWNRQDDGSKSILIRSIPHAVTHVVSKHARGAALSLV